MAMVDMIALLGSDSVKKLVASLPLYKHTKCMCKAFELGAASLLVSQR